MTLVIGTEGVEGVFTDGVGYGFAKATDGVRNVTLTAK